MASTNVFAEAINTLEWLSTAATTFLVPVFQRAYRWDTDTCDQLLTDLRAVALGEAGQSHFYGSILSTDAISGDVTERMLVDGQQRVTTVMLLLAAIRDRLAGGDEQIRERIQQLLLHPAGEARARLKLRKEGSAELDTIVLGGPLPEVGAQVSHLQDNYAFFTEAIHGDALVVWAGLQRLEHVAITLGEYANPQQVFESLNSTGARLRNHELVHNYVLMGLTDRQQIEIEDHFWVPIEANTGDAIDSFLRDYLVLRTGRDSDLSGDRGIYQAFRREFPILRYEQLTTLAAEWRSYSEVYRLLLNPSSVTDGEVGQQLGYLNTFGTALYPLLLQVYRDHQLGHLDRHTLLETLEQLQSMYLRRMLVGANRDHLAAQLCRKRRQYGYPIRAIARRTPSDERVREALRYRALPHAVHVLQRIDGLGSADGLQVEHVFPQFPGDGWRGSEHGLMWRDFSEMEKAKYREILSTIGNLTLLERELNAAASNKPFHDKKPCYDLSDVPSAKALVDLRVWDLEVVSGRTQQMADRFLDIWRRPAVAAVGDPEHLVPILDAERKAGFYPDWKTEFDYVRFGDEVWEVRNVKELFQRVFTLLWTTRPADVLAYCAAHNGPVFETELWRSRWQPLPGSHYLFMAMFPQYMLAAVQGILDYLDMADDVYVRYSADDD